MSGLPAEIVSLALLAATLAVPAAAIVLVLGMLSQHQVCAELRGLAPTVAFLAAVLVLAELADRHGLFVALGAWIRQGRAAPACGWLALVLAGSSARWWTRLPAASTSWSLRVTATTRAWGRAASVRRRGSSSITPRARWCSYGRTGRRTCARSRRRRGTARLRTTHHRPEATHIRRRRPRGPGRDAGITPSVTSGDVVWLDHVLARARGRAPATRHDRRPSGDGAHARSGAERPGPALTERAVERFEAMGLGRHAAKTARSRRRSGGGRIRTCDRQLRRLLLYPLSYAPRCKGTAAAVSPLRRRPGARGRRAGRPVCGRSRPACAGSPRRAPSRSSPRATAAGRSPCWPARAQPA